MSNLVGRHSFRAFLHKLSTLIDKFVKQEGLPASYAKQAEDWFLPLAERISSSIPGARPLLLGISGGQGTGKSTLARLLELVLSERHGLRVARLSIDDFYLTRAERKELAEKIHPLLMTRGVPGTHDTTLLDETLDRLNSLQSGESCPLPRFDKAIDDRVPEGEFEVVEGPVDVVILEGWCVGFVGHSEEDEWGTVDEWYRDFDPDGNWRRFINSCLENDYAAIFERIDTLVFIRAPDFDTIRR